MLRAADLVYPTPQSACRIKFNIDDTYNVPLSSQSSASNSPLHSKKNKRAYPGHLSKQVTEVLRVWILNHVHYPYPTEDEKCMLTKQTGLSICQVNNWFINARRRILRPLDDVETNVRGANGKLVRKFTVK